MSDAVAGLKKAPLSDNNEVQVLEPREVLLFADKVHRMVSKECLTGDAIVFWVDGGNGFFIDSSDTRKLPEILREHFGCSSYSSLESQLIAHGWKKEIEGNNAGCFFHPHFDRDGTKDFGEVSKHQNHSRVRNVAVSVKKSLTPLNRVNDSSGKGVISESSDDSHAGSPPQDSHSDPSQLALTVAVSKKRQYTGKSEADAIVIDDDDQPSNKRSKRKVAALPKATALKNEEGSDNQKGSLGLSNGTSNHSHRHANAIVSNSIGRPSNQPKRPSLGPSSNEDQDRGKSADFALSISSTDSETLGPANSAPPTKRPPSNIAFHQGGASTAHTTKPMFGKSDIRSHFSSTKDRTPASMDKGDIRNFLSPTKPKSAPETPATKFSANMDGSVNNKPASGAALESCPQGRSVDSPTALSVPTNNKLSERELTPYRSSTRQSPITTHSTETDEPSIAANASSTGERPIDSNDQTEEAAIQPVKNSSVGGVGDDGSDTFGTVDDASDIELASTIYRKVEAAAEVERHKIMLRYLQEKRDDAIADATAHAPKPEKVYEQRLVSTNTSYSSVELYCLPCNTALSLKGNTNGEAIILSGLEGPLPYHKSPIMMPFVFCVEDQTDLTHVEPFHGDDEGEKIVRQAYGDEGIQEREIALVRGAQYHTEARDKELDCMLTEIAKKKCGENSQGGVDTSKLKECKVGIIKSLAEAADISCDWVEERYRQLFENPAGTPSECEDDVESPAKEDEQYLVAIDSFRNMFCNRCYIYDCNIHGGDDPDSRFNPRLSHQYLLARQREVDGYWNNVESPFIVDNTESSSHNSEQHHVAVEQLSGLQKQICYRLFNIFQGDATKMASTMGASPSAVECYIAEQKFELPVLDNIFAKQSLRRKHSTAPYYSARQYAKFYKLIANSDAHPWYTPCDHEGMCDLGMCSCIDRGFFCTKACVNAEYSPYFFRGCDCKGACKSNGCTCFSYDRECDPDLCTTCEACTDPPNQVATTQRCCNDNIGMRRHRRTLLGKSSVPCAGWGLFTKDALKRDDYVDEYVGELISQEEADRRGLINDEQNMSYMFTTNDNYALDAFRKGNKMRFVNNDSNNPNVGTSRVFVNGDVRIKFFAKNDIEAQEELFIDYGTAFKPAWRKK